ncbi:MAG: hypothetical protein O3A31_13640, partial [Planctomycetota bacterium]|nr:hypothetical protein [Planctomycetota bacterium]
SPITSPALAMFAVDATAIAPAIKPIVFTFISLKLLLEVVNTKLSSTHSSRKRFLEGSRLTHLVLQCNGLV